MYHVYDMCLACIWYVYDMFMVYGWHVCIMCMTLIWYVHGMFES